MRDHESWFLQVPLVMASEVVALALETRVKITQLERHIITPRADNRIELYGGSKISGDAVIEFDNTLFVDKIDKNRWIK